MKLELKENMYIRTNEGIRKILNEFEEGYELDRCLHYRYPEGHDLYKDDLENDEDKIVTKPSFNIIDLIEVGDYVNGYYVSKIWEKDEITHYVDGTPIKRKEREIVIQAPSYGGIEILKNKNIKSIVTKEQFGNVSYKIEV